MIHLQDASSASDNKMNPTRVELLGRVTSVVLTLNLILAVTCFVNPLRNTTDTEVEGAEPGPRAGRFLFDTLFGIEETSYNSDDDEPVAAQNTLKSCDCGE